ncbi:alpha/beta fold hydrolase [Erythrobacter donghaensis]|uniref:alpha/beta fold hydrolase n=1 Tax=Erythrobacter donghaensis TaxID=267135 RepID=UPI001302E43B|nr:alpha/beta fold hydrolase [Erythrobacter donghaensis]
MTVAFWLSSWMIVGTAHAEPGALTYVEPVADAPAGMLAWRIRYETLDDIGETVEVTGMVVAPIAGTMQRRRVIAWTHGTWGVVQKCAPSLSPEFFAVTPALDAVKNGYVVVATDYPGLGGIGPHPYLVGPITARSVLDSVRAAQKISGAYAGSEYAAWGESQGGHAALWTGQLSQRYAPDLNLVGVAAGAPPTDLATNFRQASDPNAKMFLTAMTASSWSEYYDTPLEMGRKRTPAIMRKLASNCIKLGSAPRLGAIAGILTLRRDLKKFDFAGTAPWSSYLQKNSVAANQPVPVLIAQTRDDPLVAADVTRKYARRLCANRVALKWIDLPGKDHGTTARQSAPQTLEWISQRFDRKEAPTDCRSI